MIKAKVLKTYKPSRLGDKKDATITNLECVVDVETELVDGKYKSTEIYRLRVFSRSNYKSNLNFDQACQLQVGDEIEFEPVIKGRLLPETYIKDGKVIELKDKKTGGRVHVFEMNPTSFISGGGSSFTYFKVLNRIDSDPNTHTDLNPEGGDSLPF